jgi:hypothetical protein
MIIHSSIGTTRKVQYSEMGSLWGLQNRDNLPNIAWNNPF